MWKESSYDHMPSLIDESISEKYVYVRKDVKKTEDGYTCKEAKIPKEYYSLYEQNLALYDKAEVLEVNAVEQQNVIEGRIAELETRFRKLIDMQGLTVAQIDEHQFEVFKPSFDADNPIPYVDGMELVNNAFYLKDGKVYVWMNEWVEW